MRKLITLLLAVLLTATVWAQAPQKMSYQAVIRNSGGTLVTSTQIGMEINIRQGSQAGTIVYTETQTPTTNANGLVSIEIGGGAGFSTINWASDNYYIETKTAVVAPLTTYTITGVSQLLSVPYALNAKTAETFTGTITETDPTFTSSQAANITAGDITKLSNLSGVNTGDQNISGIATNAAAITTLQGEQTTQNAAIALNTAKVGITPAQAAAIVANTAKNTYPAADATKLAGIATGAEVNVNADWNAVTGDAQILNKPTIPAAADGSETKVTAGTNVTVTGAGTTASPYVVNATGATALTIGQSYQGGVIFWLDATGQHGLIAATADQSTGIQWYNGTYRYTGTTGDGLYAGAMNTAMIVATQMADNQTGNFAAKVCADYSVTVGVVTYGDWYLPSKYELNLLYLQKVAVGGFASAYYWSSTENNNNNAWILNFANGLQYTNNKLYTYYVRAVRAF